MLYKSSTACLGQLEEISTLLRHHAFVHLLIKNKSKSKMVHRVTLLASTNWAWVRTHAILFFFANSTADLPQIYRRLAGICGKSAENLRFHLRPICGKSAGWGPQIFLQICGLSALCRSTRSAVYLRRFHGHDFGPVGEMLLRNWHVQTHESFFVAFFFCYQQKINSCRSDYTAAHPKRQRSVTLIKDTKLPLAKPATAERPRNCAQRG